MSRIGQRVQNTVTCTRCQRRVGRIDKRNICSMCRTIEAEQASIARRKADGTFGKAERIDWG